MAESEVSCRDAESVIAHFASVEAQLAAAEDRAESMQ